MGASYLIDTNVVIDFSENKLASKGKTFVASIIDGEPHFSVINKIELLGFSDLRQEIVELVERATIIGLTDEIISLTIAIRKKHRIKLPDAIIAATAAACNLVLVTNDLNDFSNIKGLKVINPAKK